MDNQWGRLESRFLGPYPLSYIVLQSMLMYYIVLLYYIQCEKYRLYYIVIRVYTVFICITVYTIVLRFPFLARTITHSVVFPTAEYGTKLVLFQSKEKAGRFRAPLSFHFPFLTSGAIMFSATQDASDAWVSRALRFSASIS